MNPLLSQVSELKEERKALLDRLLTIGGIGALYKSESVSDSSENTETAEELIDPEAEVNALRMRYRNRPSQLADALTRKARRDYNKLQVGPKVAWVPQQDKMMAALDEAEDLGKKQA